MPTITVPKEILKNKDLIAVPRVVYEKFLAWQKSWQKKAKTFKTFRPTTTDKKALAQARRDYAKGNYVRWETLKHELGLDH